MCNSTNLPLSERDAFVQEVRERHHKQLLVYALGIRQQYNLTYFSVNDLLQDLYVALLVKWPASEKGYRKKGLGYLCNILKFDGCDALRKQKSSKRQEELFLLKYAAPVDIKGIGLEGRTQELYEFLQNHLDEGVFLIMCYYIEGYPYKEIAELLDMSINTVGTKIRRAKKKIGDMLASR